MRNLNCGLNAAMSSAAKFYDGTREVRAIGILRFSPGRLIPLNSRGEERVVNFNLQGFISSITKP